MNILLTAGILLMACVETWQLCQVICMDVSENPHEVHVPFTIDSAARPDLLANGHILRRGLLQDVALTQGQKKGGCNPHFF